VTLGGYAYQGSLTRDAERAVKRVAGVDKVIDKIAVLPVSFNDDDIRWRTFYAIYTNDFLSRYGPGGGLLWGHRHPFRRDMWGPFSAFPGMQPIGIGPISHWANSNEVDPGAGGANRFPFRSTSPGSSADTPAGTIPLINGHE